MLKTDAQAGNDFHLAGNNIGSGAIFKSGADASIRFAAHIYLGIGADLQTNFDLFGLSAGPVVTITGL